MTTYAYTDADRRHRELGAMYDRLRARYGCVDELLEELYELGRQHGAAVQREQRTALANIGRTRS